MAHSKSHRLTSRDYSSGVEFQASTGAFVSSAFRMNGSSLPTEILQIVVDDLIFEYTKTKANGTTRLSPHWYLTPFLRVCKQWHAVGVKYLYRSIAVGARNLSKPSVAAGRLSHPPFHSGQLIRGEEMGHKAAKGLQRTLAANAEVAALVERLQMGDERADRHQRPEWTQTNICILQLCPNVEHVEILGFHPLGLDSLISALKAKSLVSFCISPQYLLDFKRGEAGILSLVLDMMQEWPKLRSIRMEAFPDYETAPDRLTSDTSESQVAGCCPDLRELIITGAALHPSELNLIRAMCSGSITKLVVSLYGYRVGSRADAAVDALCNCLPAWSPTLEYFKIDVLEYRKLYPPLKEAITTLRELRELQFGRMKLDVSSISELPWLERFSCLSFHEGEELDILSSHLEDLEKFPSLKHVLLRPILWETYFGKRLRGICGVRNIHLQEYLYEPCWLEESDFVL